jgi:membrane-bound lytic murein transglycosylase B
MFLTSRRLVASLGFLLSTVFVAGVAGAAPDSGAGARATSGGDGPEASSVSGSQYSEVGDGGNAGEEGDKVDKPTTDSTPPQGGDKGKQQSPTSSAAGPSPEADARSGNEASQDNRTGRQISTSQNQSRQVARQSRVQQSGQSSVSRESSGSGAANATAEQVRSQARTVESPEIRTRVRELRAKDKAGELQPAATGYGKGRRGRELRIARRDIVSQPVDELSLKRYKKLYEEAAEEYGFGEDWYVLAAVGKVESDHGQNMGPSSAGALGPMQFMPSTWESYGLDANRDGRENIMDPEDAIPAAARYLEAGGAPDDWYEALYTYNHAGWYVEKVLKMAERYRQAAGDEEVGPYYGGR